MTLDVGSRLGSYEITAAIGAGGMGEVYRGRDASLNRDVAIKVLPAALGADAERLARFRREAQVLASLNHPNIAHVYGFEGATLADGSTAYFLAMELVEGEDLAERQGSPWKVSTSGGNEPRWRPDGKELFYLAPGGRMQAVPVTQGASFTAGAPQLLFSGRFDTSGNKVYDVSKDGKRFLVNLAKSRPGAPIVVVLGLDAEIEARSARRSGER